MSAGSAFFESGGLSIERRIDKTMPGEFVQIGAFSHVIDAYLPKTRLEWLGIRCFVFDEHIVAVNWLYSLAVGRVKLKVSVADAERAAQILGEAPLPEDDPDYATADSESPRCPECNSSDVYFEKIWRRLSFVFLFFYGLPILIPRKRWLCTRCRHRWKIR